MLEIIVYLIGLIGVVLVGPLCCSFETERWRPMLRSWSDIVLVPSEMLIVLLVIDFVGDILLMDGLLRPATLTTGTDDTLIGRID